jgi:hypothetical protein
MQMLLILGPLVPCFVVMEVMAALYADLGTFRLTLLSLSAGVLTCIVLWIAFFSIPCSGPSCFLSILLFSVTLLIECAFGFSFGALPAAVSLLAGIIVVLSVYISGHIPMLRTKEYTPVITNGLSWLSAFITAFASGFGLVTSLMFFINPARTNLIYLCHIELTSPWNISAEQTNQANIGLTGWAVSALAIAFTRSEVFSFILQWTFNRISCRTKNTADRIGLVVGENMVIGQETEFGILASDLKHFENESIMTNSTLYKDAGNPHISCA